MGLIVRLIYADGMNPEMIGPGEKMDGCDGRETVRFGLYYVICHSHSCLLVLDTSCSRTSDLSSS